MWDEEGNKLQERDDWLLGAVKAAIKQRKCETKRMEQFI